MIGRRQLPSAFDDWNQRWKAPYGRFGWYAQWASLTGRRARFRRLRRWPRLCGPFGMTGNSDTRRFEYPWAFHATPLEPGMKVVEIGGGRSGFQFTLSRAGADVLNVDTAEGQSHWGVSHDLIARANRAFRTSVRLATERLEDLRLEANSIDRVFSVSTIEHIPQDELKPLMAEVGRILRPGGFFVATVDLLLDLAPFTDLGQNRYGSNVDIRKLLDSASLALHHGDPAELFGFDEFDARAILQNLPEYLYSFSYPGLAQAFVARKDSRDGRG